MTNKQIDPSRPIPDTTVFDGRLSQRGYRLNKLCASLTTPQNRAAFKAHEDAYMMRFALLEEEKELVRRRDFAGLIKAGLNIYLMIKLGACTGHSLYRMGAQMRGESYEAFLATRKIKDAV